MQSDSSTSPLAERHQKPVKATNIEVLKLNPNCCYNGCIGCSSVRRLRDFRGHWPKDWRYRLKGSVRLQAEASRVI